MRPGRQFPTSALHGVRRRRLRRQVVQPARLRGPHRGRRGARRRADRRRVRQPRPTTRRTSTNLVDRGLQPHRHGRLRCSRRPPSRRPRPTPTSTSPSSTTRPTTTSTAAPTSTTSSRSSSTRRRRRSSPATPPRPTRRPASSAPSAACTSRPSRSSWTASPRASSTTTSEKGTDVKVLGWDRAAQDGSFTGGFEAERRRKQTARSLIDQSADVLLPVGGPIYQRPPRRSATRAATSR